MRNKSRLHKLVEKEYRCPRCASMTPGIVKMGGLICHACRVIMFYPGTVEYNKAARIGPFTRIYAKDLEHEE